MDCRQFQEVISALVDNELNEDEKKEAQAHLKKCLHCFFDYKVESFIKYLVEFRFKKSTCPESLKNQIATQLISQTAPKVSVYKKIYNLILQSKIRYAIAFILIFSGISYFLINRNSDDMPFVRMIDENYHKIKSHNFPEKTIVISDPETVKQFLSANGILNPSLPKTDWKILSAGVEHYNNFPIAHLLFQCEFDTVYLMEIDYETFEYLSKDLVNKKVYDKIMKNKYISFDHNFCKIIFHYNQNKILIYAMDTNNDHAMEELIASIE